MKNTITIYGPDFSNYVRSVLLCCRIKGVKYRLLPPGRDMMNMNPFRKVPVIEHNGEVVYETAAICRYIDRAFSGPDLSSSEPIQLAWMDRWISAANCYFDPAIIRRYVLEQVYPKGENGKQRHEVIAAAEADIKRYLGIMDEALQRYDYFSGDKPGIADYLILPMLDYLTNGVVPRRLMVGYVEVEAYFAGMLERPEFQGLLGRPRSKAAS